MNFLLERTVFSTHSVTKDVMFYQHVLETHILRSISTYCRQRSYVQSVHCVDTYV